MNLLGIDPSFDHFAYSLYIEDRNKIYVGMVKTELGEKIGFNVTYQGAKDVWEKFKHEFDKYNLDTDTRVISETPPPVGQFSPGLFLLDGIMLDNIFREYKCVSEIYTLASSYLTSVHGGKYKKQESTQLAKYIINEVLGSKDFEIVIPDTKSASGRKVKGTLNNDKAESFLFLMRLFCKYDIKGYANRLMSEVGGLGYDSEKLLVSR
jgi:hypothetical protein